MEECIAAKSIKEILKRIQSRSLVGDDRYVADREILKRWDRGDGLEYLIGLLQSETIGSRLLGAYYLGELHPVEELKDAAMHLADDPLSDCRKAFVAFIHNSGDYDEEISAGLARCLHDLDVTVRVATVKWAIEISTTRFEDFARLIEAGIGRREPKFRNPLSNDFWNHSSLARGIRGLNIIRRIRGGEDIQQIRANTPDEDSFVFDSLLFSAPRRERLTARLKKRAVKN
ncbi:hypothetical protein QBK99_10875 [Corticibacterium sp. UT-5YL-CI-8]|nr:hypothetical protein [Tianweitania sp. UT-5YL-CI-8]